MDARGGTLEPARKLGDRYVPCCSGEEGPGVFRGRLTRYLQDMTLVPGEHCLVCGSPELVVDVRDLLIARGVPFDRILAEIHIG